MSPGKASIAGLWCILSGNLLAGICAAQELHGLPELAIPDSFGVNIHFTRAPDNELRLLEESGNRFIRMDLTWSGTERTRSIYDFSAYDRLVADMSKLGIRCLLILDYGNRLYDNGLPPHTDEGRQAFARWAAAAAARFRGKGILWEIWNEPNISQFWKPRPDADNYSRLALATIEAIRKADPEAFILAPASSTFPWEFFEAMGRHGVFQKLDAVSVHPYRQQAPETVEEDYCRLRLLVDRHTPGKKLPIVSGEWGYSTAWGGMNDQKQADYLVRQRLTNLWMGLPLSIWYDWHDDGPDPKEPEHHFGTVYLDYRAKPAYLAAQTLAQTLNGYRFVRRLAAGPAQDYVLLLARGPQLALVLWTTGQPHKTRLNVPGPSATIVMRDGRRLSVDIPSGGTELEISPQPQYLLLEKSEAATRLASWQPAATMNTLRTDRKNMLALKIAEPGPNRPTGRFRIMVDEGVIGQADLTAGSGRTLEIPLQYARQDTRARLARIILEEQKGIWPDLQSAWVWLLRDQLISATVLPLLGRDLTVLLHNPSGQAMGLELLVKSDRLLARPTVHLGQGMAEASISVELPPDVPDEPKLQVEAIDKQGQIVLQTDPVLWRTGASPAARGQWQVSLEGDKMVPAQAKVELARPRAGLPQRGIAQAVELAYRFGSGWRYAALMPPADQASISGQPGRLGMWVWGDGSANILRCRFVDSTGQTFQPTFGPILWTGWRWVEMPLDGRGAGHWGGANDGTVHYPIRWNAVLLLDSANTRTDQELSIQATGFAVGY